jgi:hypothetical protein
MAGPRCVACRLTDRNWLLDMAFRCHAPTMLEPFAPYRRLRDILNFGFVKSHRRQWPELSFRQLPTSDLATWYLLAWSGESLRRERHHRSRRLMAKGDSFDAG